MGQGFEAAAQRDRFDGFARVIAQQVRCQAQAFMLQVVGGRLVEDVAELGTGM